MILGRWFFPQVTALNCQKCLTVYFKLLCTSSFEFSPKHRIVNKFRISTENLNCWTMDGNTEQNLNWVYFTDDDCQLLFTFEVCPVLEAGPTNYSPFTHYIHEVELSSCRLDLSLLWVINNRFITKLEISIFFFIQKILVNLGNWNFNYYDLIASMT